MRHFRFTFALALAGATFAAQAQGQEIRQPSSIRLADFTYNDYYAQEPPPPPIAAQPSPSDLVIPPVDSMSGCAALGCAAPGCAAPGCAAPACGGGCGGCCPPPLFTFSGWLNGGYTYNAWEPQSRYNGTLSFNDRDDEFQMNQAYFVLERQTDTSENLFDIGGRMDFIYGTDSRFTQAAGLELDQNGTGGLNAGQRFYQLAFPQFYADLAVNDLTIRIGHWYTIIGYEVVTAPDNFFYSHAYTMQYGEPFTHTGALTMYQLADNITLYNGIHYGWDIFNVSNLAPAFTNRGSYIGGASWSGLDDLVSFTSTMSIGNENNGGSGAYQQRTIFSNVASLNLTDNLQWVGQCDIGRQIGGSQTTAGLDAEWYGINQYLFYTLSDAWQVGGRMEWFRDDDGARVAAVGNANPATGPFAGDFFEITMGANWRPFSNLVVRPEMRWDWFDPNAGIGSPFNDAGGVGRNNSQFTAAIDGIVTW
ncbi:MAG: porin [Pirellulaceae bacterium]